MKEIEMPAIIENELTEVEAKEARKITDEIVQLRRATDMAFIEIGKRFREIRDRSLYKAYSCRSFVEYISMPEIGYAVSTVYAYIGMVEAIEKYNINPEIFNDLSSDKFRIILPRLNEKNKDELMAKALSLSKGDLRVEVHADHLGLGRQIPKVWVCSHCGRFRWDAVVEEICPGH